MHGDDTLVTSSVPIGGSASTRLRTQEVPLRWHNLELKGHDLSEVPGIPESSGREICRLHPENVFPLRNRMGILSCFVELPAFRRLKNGKYSKGKSGEAGYVPVHSEEPFHR